MYGNGSEMVTSSQCRGGSEGRYASNSSRRRSVVGSHFVKPASFCRNTTSVPCTARTFRSVLCIKTVQQTSNNAVDFQLQIQIHDIQKQVLPKVIWEECIATLYGREWTPLLHAMPTADESNHSATGTSIPQCHMHPIR